MTRYFFDISDGNQVIADTIGVELPDEKAARYEATKTITEIAAQEIPGDGPHRTFRIAVHLGDGKTLFSVTIQFDSQNGGAENSAEDSFSGNDDDQGH